MAKPSARPTVAATREAAEIPRRYISINSGTMSWETDIVQKCINNAICNIIQRKSAASFLFPSGFYDTFATSSSSAKKKTTNRQPPTRTSPLSNLHKATPV